MRSTGRPGGRASGSEVLGSTLKEVAVRQHREGSRTAALVSCRDAGRVEVATDDAPARGSALDLRDHCRTPLAGPRLECFAEAARGRGIRGATAHFRERNRPRACGDLLVLALEDAGEDVRNSAAVHVARARPGYWGTAAG